MPKSAVAVFLLLLSCCAFSQNSVTIKGKVLDDKTQVPIEAATVYLTSVADSTVVDYTITDKSGAFALTTKKISKPVFLKISFVGYKYFQQKLETLDENKDFGILRMTEDDNMLGEVTVKSEAPPIRIKSDTLEFNASSFKVRPDSNVETLLKQLPGVEIDADGKITVNGKEVNQILVNGKPFFDKDGKIALQNLPSDIINKVQITDSKTKKEEITGQKASSNEASINLTIDEDKNKGFFGKFMGGYGSDKRYESSLMVNYFKNKRKISVLASSNNINSTGFTMNEIFDSMGGGRNNSIYTNDNGSFGINGMRFGGGNGITRSNLAGINYSDEWAKNLDGNGSYFFTGAKSENVNRTRQVNFLPDGNFTTESNARTEDDKFAHNFNFDVEYKIDSTLTLSVNPKLVRANSKYTSNSSEASTAENGELLNENTSDTFDESDNYSFSNAVYLNKNFKRKGRSGNVYVENENTKEEVSNLNRSFTTFYEDTNNDSIPDTTTEDNRNQKRSSRNLKDKYSFGAEYYEPLKDSLQLKLAVNYTHEASINDRYAYDFDAITGEYSIPNEFLTNHLYSATRTVTPTAGFTLEKKDFSWSATLGTDLTQFSNESFYLGDFTALKKNYMLPSINSYANLKFSKSRSMWVNYSYQVDFPTASQVLPVEDISNALNTIVGNPDLDPNQSHYAYVSFRDYDYATKSGYSFYAGGNFYDKQVVSSTTFDASRKRTTTYENVSGAYYSWFGGNWSKSIKKEAHSFRFGFGLNAGRNRNKGFTNGEEYDAKSLRLTPGVHFTYDYGELLSINPKYNFTYSDTRYTNYVVDKQTNVLHKFSLQTTTYWPKHVVFGNDFSYTYNSNIADGFKKDFYLWNTSLGYNFFSDKLLAKVKVYDLLNQNQSATRTISATSIRDEENVVLKRYVMFSLTYKLEKFAGKKKEERRWFMN